MKEFFNRLKSVCGSLHTFPRNLLRT